MFCSFIIAVLIGRNERRNKKTSIGHGKYDTKRESARQACNWRPYEALYKRDKGRVELGPSKEEVKPGN